MKLEGSGILLESSAFLLQQSPVCQQAAGAAGRHTGWTNHVAFGQGCSSCCALALSCVLGDLKASGWCLLPQSISAMQCGRPRAVRAATSPRGAMGSPSHLEQQAQGMLTPQAACLPPSQEAPWAGYRVVCLPARGDLPAEQLHSSPLEPHTCPTPRTTFGTEPLWSPSAFLAPSPAGETSGSGAAPGPQLCLMLG